MSAPVLPADFSFTCPACTAENTAVALRWGDGLQRTKFAPVICGHCAAVMVINLANREVAMLSSAQWERVGRLNPRLMGEIAVVRAGIIGRSRVEN